MPAQHVDGFRHVHRQTLADRLAAVEALKHCQGIDLLLHEIGQLEQHGFTLAGRQFAPASGFEGGTGSAHRRVNVAGVTGGNIREMLAGGRVSGRQGFTRGGRRKATVDKGFIRQGQIPRQGGDIIERRELLHRSSLR